jgi:hypothetical protein
MSGEASLLRERHRKMVDHLIWEFSTVRLSLIEITVRKT